MPIQLKVDAKLAPLTSALEGVFSARRLNSTIASALTKTAVKAKAELIVQTKAVFDRPTPWVINGTFVQTASANKLTAFVGWKDEGITASGVPAGKTLLAEIYGGQRKDKRFEAALRAAGVLPSGYQAAPGPSARLDSYGNMSASLLSAVISAARGYSSLTNRVRGKRSKADEYFIIRVGDPSHLGPGVYQRQGTGFRKILNFIKPVRYRTRLPEERIVADVVNKYFEQYFVEYAQASLQRLAAKL
jgi:hypothetical protein